MLQYADYRYYAESYHGTTITEDSFPTAMRDASAFIREITVNRVDPDAVPDDVKDRRFHPLAGGHWTERMWPDRGKEITRAVAAYCGGKAK